MPIRIQTTTTSCCSLLLLLFLLLLLVLNRWRWRRPSHHHHHRRHRHHRHCCRCRCCCWRQWTTVDRRQADAWSLWSTRSRARRPPRWKCSPWNACRRVSCTCRLAVESCCKSSCSWDWAIGARRSSGGQCTASRCRSPRPNFWNYSKFEECSCFCCFFLRFSFCFSFY